jgi:hypothetical protein
MAGRQSESIFIIDEGLYATIDSRISLSRYKTHRYITNLPDHSIV